MKRVWITGASSGIGEALAIAFSREGAHVLLSARNANELERVRSLCSSSAEVLPFDVTSAEIPRVEDVDVLVLSAGVSQRALAAETDLATDRQIMDINYFGSIAVTKSVLPSMLKRGRGHIVPISSVIGYVGVPLRSAYAASKHALHGFFNALRAENHKHGIRVTIVCPGYIRTHVSENALRGDGTRYGITDETHAKAMLPEAAAPRIIRAIEAGRDEVHVGGPEIYAIPLQRHFPRLTARILRRRG